jgi:hypothetical protein
MAAQVLFSQRAGICREHITALLVEVGGQAMRFCMSCCRLQPVVDFAGRRRSCRQALVRVERRVLQYTCHCRHQPAPLAAERVPADRQAAARDLQAQTAPPAAGHQGAEVLMAAIDTAVQQLAGGHAAMQAPAAGAGNDVTATLLAAFQEPPAEGQPAGEVVALLQGLSVQLFQLPPHQLEGAQKVLLLQELALLLQ